MRLSTSIRSPFTPSKKSLASCLSVAPFFLWEDLSFAKYSTSLIGRLITLHALELAVQQDCDLSWWKILLKQWHGISVIRSPSRPILKVYTDASGKKGIGGIW